MPRFTRLILLAAVALVATFLAASPSSAIMHSLPDDQHPYVGIVFNDAQYCTGSAISPTVVVTAAHCLSDGTNFSVSFAEQPAQSPVDGWPLADAPGVVTGTGYNIGGFCQVEVDPTCPSGNPGFTRQVDVAVVVLDTPVSLPRYGQLPEVGLVDALPKSQPMTESGYGVNFRSNGTYPGRPFLETAVDRRMTPTILQPSNSASDKYLRQQPTNTHAQFCFGDSGGPTLLGNSDTLLGVHSWLNNANCQGGITASARIDTPEVLAAIRSYL